MRVSRTPRCSVRPTAARLGRNLRSAWPWLGSPLAARRRRDRARSERQPAERLRLPDLGPRARARDGLRGAAQVRFRALSRRRSSSRISQPAATSLRALLRCGAQPLARVARRSAAGRRGPRCTACGSTCISVGSAILSRAMFRVHIPGDGVRLSRVARYAKVHRGRLRTGATVPESAPSSAAHGSMSLDGTGTKRPAPDSGLPAPASTPPGSKRPCRRSTF
jgi:hypothetical protein